MLLHIIWAKYVEIFNPFEFTIGDKGKNNAIKTKFELYFAPKRIKHTVDIINYFLEIWKTVKQLINT